MSSFSPAPAVLMHAHGATVIQAEVVGLEEEDNLLIHSCQISASRQKERLLDHEGRLWLRADFDAVLTWTVRASVLGYAGLADYHPGTPLPRQALAFAQANRTPHQFLREASGQEIGVLYYEDPTSDTAGGDTPEGTFRITLEFSDHDTTSFAAIEGEDDPVVYVPSPTPAAPDELTVQASAPLEVAIVEASAAAVAHGATSGLTGNFCGTLYDGDPAAGGVAVSSALVLTPWLDLTQPDTQNTTVARNTLGITWPADPASRSVSHIRLTRGADTVSDIALDSTVTVPADTALRAPAGALGIHLTWNQEGDMAASTDEPPASTALRWVMGDEALSPATTEAYVLCFDGDPFASGVFVGDTDLTLPRDSSGFTLSGAEITSAADVTGTATAPGGGWSITHVAVGIDPVQTWFMLVELASPISVAAGGHITIPAGALTVTPASA